MSIIVLPPETPQEAPYRNSSGALTNLRRRAGSVFGTQQALRRDRSTPSQYAGYKAPTEADDDEIEEEDDSETATGCRCWTYARITWQFLAPGKTPLLILSVILVVLLGLTFRELSIRGVPSYLSYACYFVLILATLAGWLLIRFIWVHVLGPRLCKEGRIFSSLIAVLDPAMCYLAWCATNYLLFTFMFEDAIIIDNVVVRPRHLVPRSDTFTRFEANANLPPQESLDVAAELLRLTALKQQKNRTLSEDWSGGYLPYATPRINMATLLNANSAGIELALTAQRLLTPSLGNTDHSLTNGSKPQFSFTITPSPSLMYNRSQKKTDFVPLRGLQTAEDETTTTPTIESSTTTTTTSGLLPGLDERKCILFGKTWHCLRLAERSTLRFLEFIALLWTLRDVLINVIMFYFMMGLSMNFNSHLVKYLTRYSLLRSLQASWVRVIAEETMHRSIMKSYEDEDERDKETTSLLERGHPDQALAIDPQYSTESMGVHLSFRRPTERHDQIDGYPQQGVPTSNAAATNADPIPNTSFAGPGTMVPSVPVGTFAGANTALATVGDLPRQTAAAFSKLTDTVLVGPERREKMQRFRVDSTARQLPRVLWPKTIERTQTSAFDNLTAIQFCRLYPPALYLKGVRFELRSKKIARSLGEKFFDELLEHRNRVAILSQAPAATTPEEQDRQACAVLRKQAAANRFSLAAGSSYIGHGRRGSRPSIFITAAGKEDSTVPTASIGVKSDNVPAPISTPAPSPVGTAPGAASGTLATNGFAKSCDQRENISGAAAASSGIEGGNSGVENKKIEKKTPTSTVQLANVRAEELSSLSKDFSRTVVDSKSPGESETPLALKKLPTRMNALINTTQERDLLRMAELRNNDSDDESDDNSDYGYAAPSADEHPRREPQSEMQGPPLVISESGSLSQPAPLLRSTTGSLSVVHERESPVNKEGGVPATPHPSPISIASMPEDEDKLSPNGERELHFAEIAYHGSSVPDASSAVLSSAIELQSGLTNPTSPSHQVAKSTPSRWPGGFEPPPPEDPCLTKHFFQYLLGDRTDEFIKTADVGGRNRVNKKQFTRLTVELYKLRKQLLSIVTSQKAIHDSFRRLLLALLTVVCLLFTLLYLGVSVNTIIASGAAALSAVVVAMSFLYSNFIQSVVFVCFLNPYNVGDRVRIFTEIMTVKKIDTFFTEFADAHSKPVMYTHSFLYNVKIINESRSKRGGLELCVYIADSTAPSKYHTLKKRIKEFCEQRGEFVKGSCFFILNEVALGHYLKFTVWASTVDGWHHYKSVWTSHGLLWQHIIRHCEDLGIEYKLPVQRVEPTHSGQHNRNSLHPPSEADAQTWAPITSTLIDPQQYRSPLNPGSAALAPAPPRPGYATLRQSSLDVQG